MRNRMLVMALTALLCLALSSMLFAASTTAKPAVKAAKPAKFDQKAVMEKFWKAPDSTVVGTVNGAKVTKGELLRDMWNWNAPSSLGDVLNQKMIEEAAKKNKISLTQAEMQAQINDSLKRMNMTSVDQLLNQFKITYDRFISGTRISALAQKIVQRQVVVTDAEYAEWMKARHILIRFPQDITDKAKQEEAAKTKIDAIALRLKNGEDFAKVATEVSEDPGSAKMGGDLGWFTKGRMVQEFEKVAFDLKAGQVSEPIKTFYGYHIIEAEKLGRDATGAEKAELKKMILEKKVPMAMGQWFQGLQAKAKINNMLMPPPEKPKQPAVNMQQPAPKPAAPRPAPPAPKVEAPKPAPTPAPAASEKPETTPPPPPPAPAQ
ncbi:MAG: peptidylprolyl isomerase [Armatimonadetes bacterium]|nr:peptidylprolyl isomerase [Armatimonadota bacterium]